MWNESHEKDDRNCSEGHHCVKNELRNVRKQLLNNLIFNYAFFKKQLALLFDKHIHISQTAVIRMNKA